MAENENSGGNFIWAVILVLLLLGLIVLSIYLWQ